MFFLSPKRAASLRMRVKQIKVLGGVGSGGGAPFGPGRGGIVKGQVMGGGGGGNRDREENEEKSPRGKFTALQNEAVL